MGGRRSAATERVQGRITSDSKRPPHSHFSVSTAARRAPPRVHDHDARDGLMMGWVLGGSGNVLDIGFCTRIGAIYGPQQRREARGFAPTTKSSSDQSRILDQA